MPFNRTALHLPTFKPGSEGPAVIAWQKFLFNQNLPMVSLDFENSEMF
jgi:hypothetical protein